MNDYNHVPLLDVNGKKIHAHGGSIIKIDGTFYWYGENKEGIWERNGHNKCPYWHHGMKYYSSKDLISWQDEGFLIEENGDENSPFHSKNVVDRPHVIFNKKINKYVCWCKTCTGQSFSKTMFSICIGDTLNKMQYVKSFIPEPFEAGDFDLFEYEDKGYIIFENPHYNMVLYELSDDYMSLGKKYSTHIDYPYPPYVREAPCFFTYNKRLYILTSGTTGYYPNSTICYDITNLHGEWKEVNHPCIKDIKNNSFSLQFSSVFNFNNRLIALGDRWLNDIKEDMPDINEIFKWIYSKGKEGLYLSDEQLGEVLSLENTSLATYVWLDIEFIDGKPIIENKNNY